MIFYRSYCTIITFQRSSDIRTAIVLSLSRYTHWIKRLQTKSEEHNGWDLRFWFRLWRSDQKWLKSTFSEQSVNDGLSTNMTTTSMYSIDLCVA